MNEQSFLSLSHAQLAQGRSEVSISSIPATMAPTFVVKVNTDPDISVSFDPVPQDQKSGQKPPLLYFGPFPSSHLRNTQKGFSEALKSLSHLAELRMKMQCALLNAEQSEH